MRDVWTRYVPFESLPQVLNPRGGYIHNENDSPHFTNVKGPVDTSNAFPNFEKPDLSLRGQLAIQLIGGDQKLSLEDVVRLKHSYRMLLADRVKADLIAAVKAKEPTGDVAAGSSVCSNAGTIRRRLRAKGQRSSNCGGPSIQVCAPRTARLCLMKGVSRKFGLRPIHLTRRAGLPIRFAPLSLSTGRWPKPRAGMEVLTLPGETSIVFGAAMLTFRSEVAPVR